MDILAISGAHRDSNTEKLLSEIIKGCKENGASVKIIRIRKSKIAQCCGWSDCYYENYCIVNDNMQEIYKQADNARAWILATPTYFDNVSGHMKIFMDRMNPYCKPPRYKGKKIVLAAVGGAGPCSIKRCIVAMKRFAKHMHLTVVGTVMARADKEKEIYSKKKVIKEAREIGKMLVQQLATKKK